MNFFEPPVQFLVLLINLLILVFLFDPGGLLHFVSLHLQKWLRHAPLPKVTWLDIVIQIILQSRNRPSHLRVGNLTASNITNTLGLLHQMTSLMVLLGALVVTIDWVVLAILWGIPIFFAWGASKSARLFDVFLYEHCGVLLFYTFGINIWFATVRYCFTWR